MRDFRKLKAWEKAHHLTLEVYKASSNFPREERYGLTQQIRRAVSSIPTNITEGCGREGDRELARFCSIAAGSTSECEYQLLLAKDLGYLCDEKHMKLTQEVREIRKMLSSLINRLKADS